MQFLIISLEKFHAYIVLSIMTTSTDKQNLLISFKQMSQIIIDVQDKGKAENIPAQDRGEMDLDHVLCDALQ